MKQNVFNAPPFSTYLAQVGGDVRQAVIALLQKSVDLQPSSIAYYQKAWLTAIPLITSAAASTSAVEISVASSSLRDIAYGDTLPLNPPSPAIKVYMLLLRANTIALDGHYVSSSQGSVAAAYEKAIATSIEYTSNATVQYYLVSASLKYAEWLSAQTPAPQVQISHLVHNITSLRVPSFETALLSEKNLPSSNAELKAVTQLARVSPDFKNYLNVIGWNS